MEPNKDINLAKTDDDSVQAEPVEKNETAANLSGDYVGSNYVSAEPSEPIKTPEPNQAVEVPASDSAPVEPSPIPTPSVNPETPAPTSSEPVIAQPEAPSTPLAINEDLQHTYHDDGGHFAEGAGMFVGRTGSAQAPTSNKKSFPKIPKKVVIITASVIFGLVLLGAGGYFGYDFYVKSSDARILNKASQNILKANNLKTDFRVGASGLSIKGNMYVDKDQDIKLAIDSDLIPIEALYIKKTDTGYLKEFSILGSNDNKTKNYYEGKNVYKAIEKYGLSELGIDSLNPNKNYFDAANIKYFKKVGEDKIDGKTLYKYSLEPDAKGKAVLLEKANKGFKKSSGDNDYFHNVSLNEFDTTLNIWIAASDLKVYKVEGESKGKYSYQYKDTSECYKIVPEPSYSSGESQWNEYDAKVKACEAKPSWKDKSDKFAYEWALNLDYSYSEDIFLPKDAKIVSSTDLTTGKTEQTTQPLTFQKLKEILLPKKVAANH